MNTLEIIKAEGLSVRRVPLQVISLLTSIKVAPPGSEIVERKIRPISEEEYTKGRAKGLFQEPDFSMRDGYLYRKFERRVVIPKYAGYWMCQACGDTSSTMRWDYKTCHLAPTLEESVALYMQSKQVEPEHYAVVDS